MQPLGKVLKTLIPELTSVSEKERYVCEGCGNNVVVVESPILGGPRKGELTRFNRGCICWEMQQAKEAHQERKVQRINHIVNRYSTVNPDLENASFDTFARNNQVLEQAFRLSVDYVDKFSLDKPMNLLFAGMYGLGKSHLSYSICKALRDKDYVAVFISTPKLLTIIKSTYQTNSEFSEAELLDVLSKVDFLALDDIGAEKVKKDEEGDSWATEKLFEIIDGRSGRSTLYTTNLNSEQLQRKMGPRNFSRMMMNTKPFKFEGEDYRINNKRF